MQHPALKVAPLSHRRFSRPLLVIAAVALLSGCGLAGGTPQSALLRANGYAPSPIFDSASQCEQALTTAASVTESATARSVAGSMESAVTPPIKDAAAPSIANQGFGDRLVLATWNTAKSVGLDLQIGLRRLQQETDILLLQEAPIIPAAGDVLSYPFVAVSEGYRAALGPTGLISASHVTPVASCSFIDREPLLRTPKASSITSYTIGENEETLLVANVHAINFSFGMGAYTRQLERITRAMQNHEGPIVFAGDFNSWNKDRDELVANLMNDLNLQEVAFGDSARKTFFGYPLDRIFWRGMSFDSARTEPLASSDHEALIATWHLQ